MARRSVTNSFLVHHVLADNDDPTCAILRIAIAFCFLMLLSTLAAAQPVLRSMQPFALKQGATTKVRFNGDGLAGVYQALCYTPGLTDANWTAREDAKQITAEITLPDDFGRGWHCLRLASKTGISELVTFYVSELAPIKENSKPHRHDTAQEIPNPSLVAGTLQPRDVDVYAFEAKQGQRISVEVQGLRTGRAMFDPRIELMGPDGSLLGQSDDTALTRQDPYLSLVAAVSGEHRLVVTESQYTGNNGFWYLLHLGSFPRPSMARQLGGKPNTELTLTWLSEEGPMFDQQVLLPPYNLDEFPVFPQDDNGVAPTPVWLRVNELPVVDETEPNGPKEPQVITIPVAVHGVLQQAGDDDLFRVTVTAGQVLDIRAFARNPGRSAIDTVLAIRKSDNSYVTSNDDANGGPDSYIRYTFPEAGDYFILIRDQMGRGQADMAYRLEIRPPTPKLLLTSPEFQRNVSVTMDIPSGNRMAMVVNANRIDWGGELKLTAESLPEQVSAGGMTLPGDRYQIPVLFVASDTAPTSAALVSIVGQTSGDTPTVTGGLEIRHRLVSGRNNVDLLSVTLSQLATVVTEPVPVKIEIVQPQVPLVRSGTMNLRIRAIREAGFTGPVMVYMLYNANGVSSQGSANIPENQDEVTLALTASAAAQLGDWPIVVLGNASVPGRNFKIATPLATLQIAESYFNLKFAESSIEQGGSTIFSVGLDVKQPFEGEGTAELLGLPPGLTAEPVQFVATSEKLDFAVQALDSARPGRYQGVSCRLTIHAHEEPIVHMLGGGGVRVDPITAKKEITAWNTHETSLIVGHLR